MNATNNSTVVTGLMIVVTIVAILSVVCISFAATDPAQTTTLPSFKNMSGGHK